MARQTMPLDEWIIKMLNFAFSICGDRFHQADDVEQRINTTFTELKGGVPKRFLNLLETSEDYYKVITDALEDIADARYEYHIFSVPGKFTREGLLEEIAFQTVGHIVFIVFGPPIGHILKFTADISEIYNFMKQKTEEAMSESEADENGISGDSGQNGIYKIRIGLRDSEKQELIQRYASSLFSIHAFIKKISREISPGQYL